MAAPRDSKGNVRRRSNYEVLRDTVKRKVGIGSGMRGRAVDREVDRITRMQRGQSSDHRN